MKEYTKECFLRWHKYPEDLFGLAEFAMVLGISKAALHMRCVRGQIIEPETRLKMGPVWTRQQVRAHLFNEDLK